MRAHSRRLRVRRADPLIDHGNLALYRRSGLSEDCRPSMTGGNDNIQGMNPIRPVFHIGICNSLIMLQLG